MFTNWRRFLFCVHHAFVEVAASVQQHILRRKVYIEIYKLDIVGSQWLAINAQKSKGIESTTGI